jgi:hypothetical protein
MVSLLLGLTESCCAPYLVELARLPVPAGDQPPCAIIVAQTAWADGDAPGGCIPAIQQLSFSTVRVKIFRLHFCQQGCCNLNFRTVSIPSSAVCTSEDGMVSGLLPSFRMFPDSAAMWRSRILIGIVS